MKLAAALRFLPPPHLHDTCINSKDYGGKRDVIAFVGAGGKTTALFHLARELAPSVVTTTTHLGDWQFSHADHHILLTGDGLTSNRSLQFTSGVTLVTGSVDEDRLIGLNNRCIKWLHELSYNSNSPLLIEADGSRQKPLKAPATHEPVIPPFTDLVIVVAGLTGLDAPLTKRTIHRPEIFASLCGMEMGNKVTAQAVVRVLTHPNGGLKGIPESARRVALINQADTPGLLSIGGKMAQELLEVFDAVLVGTLQPEKMRTFEPVAGIILAAGEGKRYGKPKQLLEWRGKPFVRHVTEAAIAAGLSPVVIVTGSHAEGVEAAIKDLPVQIIHNPNWQSGQASSIRVGLSNLSLPLPSISVFSSLRGDKGKVVEGWLGSKKVGAAIFLLADQPQVTSTVLRSLVERHTEDLNPIIAPQVNGQRANPVLFDRVVFQSLMSLGGNVGGRAVFSMFPITYLPWPDENLLLDVDTPQDYTRLLELTT